MRDQEKCFKCETLDGMDLIRHLMIEHPGFFALIETTRKAIKVLDSIEDKENKKNEG